MRHPSSDDNDPLSMSHGSEMAGDKDDGKKMLPQVAIMEPILRLLQLLCENHNRDLQVGMYHYVSKVLDKYLRADLV